MGYRAAYMRAARKRGRHTLEQWLQLLAIAENHCGCCDQQFTEKELTKDHIVPVSLGGSDAIENIQPLCRRCNTYKGTATVDFQVRAGRGEVIA